MIGEVAIPCYVVQAGDKPMRVIVQAGMIEALGMKKGGSSHARAGPDWQNLPSGDRLEKPFVSEGVNPQDPDADSRFVTTTGTLAFGF